MSLSPTQAGLATAQRVRSGSSCQHIGIPWGMSLRSGRFGRMWAAWLSLFGLAVGSGALAIGSRPARASAGQDTADLRAELSRQQRWDDRAQGPREFYFTRAIYSGSRRRWTGGRGSWAVDYPEADLQFVFGPRRLTQIDAYERDHAISLTDPSLSRFPFLYALEVGYMSMPEAEVEALRRYLLAGGFLFIDDFWGTWEWRNFEYSNFAYQMAINAILYAMSH